ncbi:glycan-binding surface protein [Desertivirga brevis]|uniref:glycan-binding surface protein n=1 Tax=Desertivirga brevis TaxID=2810310 RepID=UPI001A975B65|nr:glycan-binding surface protein [Pedobacter sp. SYSU D00873]
MKAITSFNYILGAGLALAGIFFSGCDKDAGNVGCSGAPTITKVVKPTSRTTTLDSAAFREFVTIEGQNLCSVEEIRFNDIKVSSEDYFATPTEITVRVPSDVPQEIMDKVFVATKGGEATASFVVKIPPLTIASVDNEYAPAGTTMTLVGPSFKIYGFTEGKGKVFFGDAEATITKASADTLLVIVPANATQGAAIKAVASNGATGTFAYPYKDNTNLVFDFDTKPGTSTSFITNSATPGPISGNYVRVNRNVPVWSAQEFIRGTGRLTADIVAHPENYLYKFEVNTQRPFNKQGIRMWADYGISGTYYLWNPSVSPFDTQGKWVTYSIPLFDIVKTAPITARANNDYTFRAIVYGPEAFDMDFSMDNVRIVPKK